MNRKVKTKEQTENEDLKTRSYMELSNVYKSMRHTDRDNWMTAEDAVKYGLIDKVIEKRI